MSHDTMPDDQPHLILYGRPACCLCREMERQVLEALDHLAPDPPVRLIKRDIDADAAWFDAWRLRIPVLTDARGEVLLEGRSTPDAIHNALADALASSRR